MLGKGLITKAQLDTAVEARTRSHLRFGEILVILGYVEESEVTRCLAEQYQLPVANLEKIRPTPEALGIVSSLFAMSRLFLPVAVTDDIVYAIISDPIDLELTDQIIRDTGRRLCLAIASPRELTEAIAQFYDLPGTANPDPPKATRSRARRSKFRFNDQTDRQELLAALADFVERQPAA